MTVSVTGFPASTSDENGNTITIDPGEATVKNFLTNNSGGLSGTNVLEIPSNAKEGTIEVTVSIPGAEFDPTTPDKGVTKGSATFTVETRGLTVSPTSGPKGTIVLLSGGNYISRGVITGGTIEVGGVQDELHGESRWIARAAYRPPVSPYRLVLLMATSTSRSRCIAPQPQYK